MFFFDGGARDGGGGLGPPVDLGPPEVEERRDFETPRAGARYVYVANPRRDTVAVIDSTTLAIRSVEAGDGPTYLNAVPGRDIAIVYTGLRAGEKLHETLFHADERYRPTSHPKILQAQPRHVPADALANALARLRKACAAYDLDAMASLLREAVPEFVPTPLADEAQSAVATVVAFPARSARKT